MPEQQNKDEMYNIVKSKIAYITDKAGSGPQKALLAELRRGVGYCPGELPKLWGTLLDGLPEELQSQNISEPSAAEWSIYTALTLFAVHQQGHDVATDLMYKENVSLGQAMAQLIERGGEASEDRIINRFNIVATSSSIEELSHHLRGAVNLLSAEAIPLDYAKLAKELYLYQDINLRANVRLQWGQEFYQEIYRTQKGENNHE